MKSIWLNTLQCLIKDISLIRYYYLVCLRHALVLNRALRINKKIFSTIIGGSSVYKTKQLYQLL